jgi:exopolyphosphatase/guanosine-5'-triphosphate,3'-diphosphate pyrophosphatase
MLFAVIDSGTNTFALNIYESTNDHASGFKRVHKQRFFVELLEASRTFISEEAFARALNAYRYFAYTLCERNIQTVWAMGTAAFRNTQNGQDLLEAIYEETGLRIELISGAREAELIYKGVRLAAPIPKQGYALIMDIGGGSVEFILANAEKMLWAQSFSIGAGVLYDIFKLADPAQNEELNKVEAYLHDTLAPLWAAIAQYPPQVLVGASGTFDVITALSSEKKILSNYQQVKVSEFMNILYPKLIQTSYSERVQMRQFPQTRAKLLVPVLVLIRQVIQASKVQDLAVSDYALREGVAWELVQKPA